MSEYTREEVVELVNELAGLHNALLNVWNDDKLSVLRDAREALRELAARKAGER